MGIDFSKFSPDFKKAFEAATAETSDGGKQITENEWNSFSKKDQETLTKLLAGNANALGEGLFDQQMTLRFNRANDNKPTVYQHKDNETTQTITVKPGEKLTSGSLLEASKDTIARYPDAKWGYYSNGKVTLYDEKGRTIKDSNGETVSFDFTGEGESRSELTDWYMKHNGGKFNLETFTAMQELDDRLNNMEEYETDISQLMRDIDLSELKNASEDVKASFFERLDAKAAYKKAQAQDAMLRGAKAYQDAVQNGEWQDEVLAFLSGYGAFFQSADSALGITKFKEFVKDANLAEFVMKYTGSDAIQEKLEELADDGNDDITTKTEAALSVVRMVTDAVKAYGSLNNTADSMRRLADDGDDSNLSAAENIVENIIGQAKGLDSFIGTQGAVFVGGLAAATAGATAVTVAALGEGASSAAVGTAIGEMVTGYFALEGTSLVFDGIKDAINAKTKEQAEAAGEKMGMGEFMAVGGLKIGRSVYKAGMRKVRTAQIEELTAKYREMEPQALLEELGNNPKTNNKIAITDVLIEKGYTVIEKPVIENGKIKTTETLIYSPDGKLVKGGADVAEVTTETLEDGTVVTMRNGKKYSEVTPDGTERRFNAYGETLEFRPDKTLVVYDENGNVTKTEVWENIGGSRMSLSQAKNLWMSDHLGHQTFKDGLLTEIERFINVEPRTVTNVTGTVEIAEGKLTVTRPNGTKVDLFEGIPQEVLNAPATDFMHFPDATTVPESFGVKLTQHASSPIEAQYIPTGRTVAETLQLANESGVPLKFDTEKKAFYQDAPYGGRQYVNTESITPIYTHEAEPNWGLAENYANEYGHEVQTSDGVKTYAVDRAVVTANPKPTDNGLSANCAGKQYDIVHPDGTRTPYSPDKVQPGQTFRISKREGIELKMAVFDKPTISPEGETLPAGKLLMIDADGHPYDGNPIKRIKSGEVTFDFDMNDPRQAQIKADIDVISPVKAGTDVKWLHIKTVESDGKIIGTIRDVTEETIEKQQREFERDHDPLTLFLNRQPFIDQLTRIFNVKAVHFALLAVCKLPDLSALNNRYGSIMGDKYIKSVSEVLGSLDKRTATMARTLGDELAFMIKGRSVDEITMQFNDLLDKLNTSSFKEDEVEMPHNIFAGVAWYPNNAKTVEELLSYAEFASKSAAEFSGRNLVQQFSPEAYKEYLDKQKKHAVIAEMLEKYEINYAYQPIIDTHTKRFHSMEALARLNVYGYGYVSDRKSVV